MAAALARICMIFIRVASLKRKKEKKKSSTDIKLTTTKVTKLCIDVNVVTN